MGNRCAPVLTGESARRFLEAMERADRLPRRELPENFFSDIENCLRRSKEQAEKDKSETATVGRHEEKLSPLSHTPTTASIHSSCQAMSETGCGERYRT